MNQLLSRIKSKGFSTKEEPTILPNTICSLAMSKEYTIQSFSFFDEKAKPRKCQKYVVNDSYTYPRGNSRTWGIKYTEDTSLFWNWFICNYQETIKEYFKKEDIARSEFGVDLEEFKNIDEDEIIRRLKV